jgi:hypothetical protein
MTEPITWTCPVCGQHVTTYITVSEPPTCHRHMRRTVRMTPDRQPNQLALQ